MSCSISHDLSALKENWQINSRFLYIVNENKSRHLILIYFNYNKIDLNDLTKEF